jgi:hypothetical protein
LLPGGTPPLRPEKRLLPGESLCPTCGDIIDNQFCLRCNQPNLSQDVYAPSAPGAYFTTRAPGVEEAIRYAVLGIFCAGFIFGFLAIRSGSKAKDQIARDPRLDGAGLATFAQILGAFDIVAWVIGLLRIASDQRY